eukprot:scaffold1941_cov263-Pinguiococcus_pyrenoidosus.AAC.7
MESGVTVLPNERFALATGVLSSAASGAPVDLDDLAFPKALRGLTEYVEGQLRKLGVQRLSIPDDTLFAEKEAAPNSLHTFVFTSENFFTAERVVIFIPNKAGGQPCPVLWSRSVAAQSCHAGSVLGT